MPLHLHKAFETARQYCIEFAKTAQSGEVCFCVGPGGAGKTSVACRLGPDAYGPPEKWIPLTQPFAYVEADLGDRGYFSSKSFIRACLTTVMDPFRTPVEGIAKWDTLPAIKRALQSYSTRVSRVSMSEPEMRHAFVNIGVQRRLKTLVVDEANLLVLTQRGRTPTDYLESIRCLGDQIGCNVLLFGTVRLLELTGHSAQLNRRADFVHISRMQCSDREGQREFRVFLRAIGADRGISGDLLDSGVEDIFKWTYGIPGEMVGLLERANRIQAVERAVTVNWEHIAKSRRHDSIIEQMREEADLIDQFFEGASPPGRLPRRRSSRVASPPSRGRGKG